MCNFWNKYLGLCNKKGESPSRAAQNMGYSRTTSSNWKAGAKPNDATIQRIADYFGVPFSYFDNEVKFDLQLFADGAETNPQEASLINIYRGLNEIDKAKLLIYAAELSQKG